MKTTDIKRMKLENLPFLHRQEAKCGTIFVLFGKIKKNIEASSDEKMCAGHVCRVVSATMDKAVVVREDGQMLLVWLETFEKVTLIIIEK